METLKGNIQTTINMTDSVFIFRSENGKNTCEMCRALDGKQFFPGDEIPVLPLHPNCKCELEKIKSYKDDTEKISDIENEIEEINLLSKELNKKIKDEKFEAQKLNDEIDEVENILKTESYDKSKKEEFKTIKKNADDNAQRLIELENSLNKIDTNAKKREINFRFLLEKNTDKKDFSEASNIELNEIFQNMKSFTIEINHFLTTLKKINESQKKLSEKLELLMQYLLQVNKESVMQTKIAADRTINAKVYAFVDEVGKTISKINPIGGSNIQDAMHDFDYAKNNKEAEIFDASIKPVDKNIKQTMKELKLKKGEKTVVYNKNSNQSEKLFYTSAIQNYIKTNLKRLIQAEGQPLEDKILTQSRKDFDAFVGIQHFTIHNPRITKDGYFKAVVYDKYDFEYRTTYNLRNLIDFKNIEEIPEKIKNDMFNKLNNLGFFMQEMNLLSNYDIIYYIEQKIW